MSGQRAPLQVRVVSKVEFGPATECWSWLGFIDKAGYGRIRIGGRNDPVGYAHRVMYESECGPIAQGLHIDHLCRNRSCVNPGHLEAVTCRENVARGMAPTAVLHRDDACKRGHSLSDHAYVVPRTGHRQCRICRQLRRSEGSR